MALRKLLLILSFFFCFKSESQTPMRWLTKRASASCTGILDTYSGAYVALSLRKLDNDYAGSAIRVRRSSDNSEQDIGFVNCYLDTASMKTFVGANNGLVTTWYDQSGNGWNATQSTAGLQPSIITSGSINYNNGKPAILFDGTDDYFTSSITSITTTEVSMFAVFNKTASGGAANTYSRIAALTLSGYYDYTTNGWVAIHRNGSNLSSYKASVPITDSWTANTTYLAYARLSGGSIYLTINGNSEVSGSGATNTINSNRLVLGIELLSSDSYLNGYEQEVILYASNQSGNSSGIRSNINTYYTIY